MPSESTLRVALGDTVYRVERPFGDITPADGKVTDVAVDLTGRIHVLLRRDPLTEPRGPAVVVFDQGGRRLGTWGEKLVDAHMIACAPDGQLWVVDRDSHCVEVFDEAGGHRATLGERDGPGNPFNHPSDISVTQSGEVFVADGYGHGFVHRFGKDGHAQARWGRVGTAPGEFLTVHGIWTMQDGRVLVVDRENSRIQVFDRDGAPIAILTMFHRPSDIWGDAAGRLYITDAIPTLTRLEPDLTVSGRCRPVLNGAHGLWGAPDGVLYLAEGNPSRVTRLVPL